MNTNEHESEGRLCLIGVTIREEIPGDYDPVEQVHRGAFRGELEAKLVKRLRRDGLVTVSLIATRADAIVGHILFSELVIETGANEVKAVSLAPLAVIPEFQRQGIGSELVRKGLALCRERGCGIVLVLGEPEFYTRFGFSPDLVKRLQSPYSGDYWMALELVPGALDGVSGTVRYPEAFSA